MSSNRKLIPDKKSLFYSFLVVLVVAYAIYYAFNSFGTIAQIVLYVKKLSPLGWLN